MGQQILDELFGNIFDAYVTRMTELIELDTKITDSLVREIAHKAKEEFYEAAESAGYSKQGEEVQEYAEDMLFQVVMNAARKTLGDLLPENHFLRTKHSR